MDYAAFLSSPLGLILMSAGVGVVVVVLLFKGPKTTKDRLVILHRLRPSTADAGGQSTIYIVEKKRKKGAAEPQVSFPDSVKMTMPDDQMHLADTLTMRKKLTLKAGTYRMLGREAGNLVTFAKSLADTSDQMLDNAGMTKVINRSSLIALAKGAAGLVAENIMFIVLALMAGVGVGYIMYPQFNHLPPIIEYCTRLANGSMVPRGCPG